MLEGYRGEVPSWSVSSVPGPPVSPVPGEGTGVTSVSGGRMSPALTGRLTASCLPSLLHIATGCVRRCAEPELAVKGRQHLLCP